MSHITRLLIIGSGPAGYTAAIYAARAGLNPILVTGLQAGGQLTITTDVENYPGFPHTIQGPWLMEEMKAQAENVGAKIIFDTIHSVDLSKRPFVCKGEDTFIAESVVIATGAQAKWLNVMGEEKFRGFGVSACATCDGFFFKGKKVAIIGGGNTAVEEAIYLTNFASQVTIIHRRDQFRAEKIAQERLFRNPKIEVMWDTIVEEIVGSENPKTVHGLSLRNIKTNNSFNIPIEGVFVAIGHTPQSEIFKDQISVDREGYIVTQPNSTKTSVEGIFAAGDVQDKIFRQAVTAAGQGCMAALEAEKFLSH